MKRLADANIIKYTQDKTNFDYLLELQPTGYYNSFFRVTRDYEYSWYGQFSVSPETYSLIKKDFEQIETQIH